MTEAESETETDDAYIATGRKRRDAPPDAPGTGAEEVPDPRAKMREKLWRKTKAATA